MKVDPLQHLKSILILWGQRSDLFIVCLTILFVKIIIFVARTTFIIKWMHQIDMLEISVTWPIPLMAILKMSFIIIQREKIRFLFNQVNEKFWDVSIAGPRSEMSLKKRFKLTNQYLLFHTSISVGYIGVHYLFADVPIPEGRKRWLPFLISAPFDQDQSPIHEILFALLYLKLLVSILGNAIFDYIFVYTGQHLCGQFDLLNELLANLDRGLGGDQTIVEKAKSKSFQKQIGKRIAFCVKHHRVLLRFGDEIKKLTSFIFGVQILFTSATLVLVGYTLSKNFEEIFTYAMLLIVVFSLALEFIVFAVQSGDIYYQSRSVAEAGYQCDWYVFRARAKKDLTLLIMESQKGIKMDGAGLVIINNEILVTMTQRIFSCITLLRSLGE